MQVFACKVLAAVLLLAAPCAAGAQTLRAIVIGNADYSSLPLNTPIADSNLIARTLRELGFEVELFHDVTSGQSGALRARIESRLSEADVSVLYFAGHGLHFRGENLLVPVDADLGSASSLTERSTSLTDLIGDLTRTGTGLRIVILDACRNEVTGEGGLESGFTFVEAPQGEVLIAFSTSAGELALDSVGGANSPYAGALANALLQPRAELYDVFRSVRRDVRSSTGGRQIPWISGSVERDFVFNAAAPDLPAAPAAEGAATATTPDGTSLPVDEVLWSYIRTSVDPGDFRDFLVHFASSRHAPEASERESALLAELQTVGDTRGLEGDLSPQSIVAELEPGLPGTPDDPGRPGVILDQAGSYVMRDSFRTWPLTLPPSGPLGLSAVALDCDEEAADPVDPQKLSPGLSDATVDLRRAMRACAFDLASDPTNPRLLFQFGRVLDIAGRHDWANAYYQEAADRGYGAAMVNLGFNTRQGRGIARDLERSVALYRQAAETGNLRARTNLGDAFLNGRGVEANAEEGILWLRLAASQGWPHAANALGDAYRTGRGVETDPVEAFELYRSAAGAGQTTAMANLGVAYLNGAGTAPDPRQGLEWLERAISLGNGFAPVYLGQHYLSGKAEGGADPARAMELFKLATERGNAVGYRELARGWLGGSFPGGVDPAEAYRNALFAQAGRVRLAEELVAEAGAALSEETRIAIEAEVAGFLERNGL